MKSLTTKDALIVGGTFIIAALIVAFAHTHKQQPLTAPHTDEPTFLYTQTAHSGSLVPKSDSEEWTLTLEDVSPNTVFFSDRPHRETGHESTENFIANWDEGDDSFAVNPPNAALDIFHTEGEQNVLIVELMSADYDASTQSITYDILILDGEPEDQNAFASFEQSALFIDSTFKKYNCKCTAAMGNCSCEYDFNLKSSATKEFRLSC